jgi:hypothetical protein
VPDLQKAGFPGCFRQLVFDGHYPPAGGPEWGLARLAKGGVGLLTTLYREAAYLTRYARYLPPDTSPKAAQRQQLARLVRDSPACLASLAGPEHVVMGMNQLFRHLFGNRLLAGLPLRVALPELADQPFISRLDEAYHTGTTAYGYEAVAFQDAARADPGGAVYFTFVAQAVRDAAGAVSGLLLFAYNVSTYVRAQQQAPDALQASTVQQLVTANAHLAVVNEELDLTNEELLASNEQLRVANERLSVANHQLQVYNEEIRR